MASWMIATAAILYLITAVDLAMKDHAALAVTFLAYAVANVGLMFAAKQ